MPEFSTIRISSTGNVRGIQLVARIGITNGTGILGSTDIALGLPDTLYKFMKGET